MHGFPLDTAKALLADLIGSLRPTDTFNVLLFSGGNAVLAEEPVPATAENIARALELIGDETGGGATELLPALSRTLALPREPDRSRSIVVVTDGYVTVETEAFDLIRRHLDEASLFAFGIGSSVNRFLIEGLARAGKGEPFVVTEPGEAKAQSALFRRYIESPVLTHVKARFEGFEAYDIQPLSLPDVLAARPVVLYGKWRGSPEGRLILTGQGGHGPYTETLDLGAVPPRAENRALRYLWARSRIATLSDDIKLAPDDRRASEITELGLRYKLLTAYTSFVAVDKVVRNRQPGDTTTVKQPLPLPARVSALAVGGEIPTTPEPETYLLLMVSALMLALKRLRSRGHVG
jgi:Ca-activated chloride channel family protein